MSTCTRPSSNWRRIETDELPVSRIPAGQRNRIQHTQRASHHHQSRRFYIAQHAYLGALSFEQRKREARFLDKLSHRVGQIFLKLRQGLPDDRYVAQKRKVDSADRRNRDPLNRIFGVFVDVNRNDVTRAETVGVIESAIDRVYLRLNRCLFDGACGLAGIERTRVGNRAIAPSARRCAGGCRLRLPILFASSSAPRRSEPRRKRLSTHSVSRLTILFVISTPRSGRSQIHLPPRPNITILIVSNTMIASSRSDWFLM